MLELYPHTNRHRRSETRHIHPVTVIRVCPVHSIAYSCGAAYVVIVKVRAIVRR